MIFRFTTPKLAVNISVTKPDLKNSDGTEPPMKKSILRTLLLSFLGFGILVAAIFPITAFKLH